MVETRLSLDALLIKNPPATFFVRASGDSMEGVHIASGDILVVDRSIEPRSGMVAVAAVMGELVVKRLVKRGKVLLLASENDAYEPIVVTEEGDCVIWGVVTGVVRTLL